MPTYVLFRSGLCVSTFHKYRIKESTKSIIVLHTTHSKLKLRFVKHQ